MDSKLDFAGLAAALLARARMLVTDWLPGGAMSGHEYTCADLRGGRGRSFSVNVQTGKWADFSDNELKGGDLISLYAAVKGIKQGEAAKELSDLIGYRLGEERAAAPKERVARITAPPAELAIPAMRHPRFGTPDAHWTYRDDSGGVLFYIARYNPEGEKKQYAPWCWDADFKKWTMKAWPKPRPLYGLELLSMAPDKPVLIVEGEKACDAARQIVDSYVVVTWPGGASAWHDIDWTPLHGRRLLLWPDADRHVADDERKAKKYGVALGELIPYQLQPGPAAMAGIAAVLHGQTPEIKVIDVGTDPERVDGFDAADAVAGGWGWDEFYAWARPRLSLFGPPPAPASEAEQIISPDAPPPELSELADRLPPGRNLYAEWERLGVATAQNGSPICNMDNALRVIEGREEFKELVWYDEFRKRYLTRFAFDTWQSARVREWTDVDELNLTAFMQRQLGLRRMSDEMVHKAAVTYAHHHMRNEPRDWMEGLKWDGVERIEAFFADCMGVPSTEYVRAASRNFWVGMAARIYRPGCQLDNMVVLEGGQGIGKTRALRCIGGEWYTSAKENVTSRDFFMVLHGALVVEIAELDGFNKADITRIKQVVADPVDRYRAPYARGAQDHPRMSVFVGTTNDSHYLRDSTGGRRFWPVRCGAISLEKIAEQREQLFAEAVARFKKGELWYQMPVSETAQEQEDRRLIDEWEIIVGDYLAQQEQTTTRDVAGHLHIETAKLDMILQKRIAGVLRTLGWDKKNVRGVGRVWRRIGAGEPPAAPQPELLPEDDSPPF